VPKRGRTTVDRNRLKRRIREIVRLYLLGVPVSIDVVIRVQEQAYDARFEELRAQLIDATERLARAMRKEGAS
jgi:ribonuclease P protein component